jgi:hypothetical protein
MHYSRYLKAVSVISVLVSTSAAVAQDAPQWLNIPDGRTLAIGRPANLQNGYKVDYVYVKPSNFNVVSGINIRNGNYAVTYLLADRAFEIIYNSRSTYKGVFGFGWGSPFDTRIVRMRDGTIFLQANGTGAIVAIPPSSGRSKYADMMDDVIVKEASSKPNGSEAQVHARLQNDRQYAIEMALKYNAFEPLSKGGNKTIAQGSFPLSGCGSSGTLDQWLTNGDEYRYHLYCGNKILYEFDENGFLIRGYTENMGQFRLSRDGGGRITRATKLTNDEINQVLGARRADPDYDPNLEFIWGEKGIKEIVVHYSRDSSSFDKYKSPLKSDIMTYGPRGELASLYQPKEYFGYKYAYNANLDMTRIDYSDDTSQTLTYDKDDRATGLRNRRGDVTLLRYEDKVDSCHDIVTTMFKDAYKPQGEASVFVIEHEFENGKRCEDTALEMVPG